MKIIVSDNYDDMSRKAARLVHEQIISKVNSVLGLATGFTVLGIYRILCKEGLDFSKITTVNLDEYEGIPASDKNSYRYYMENNLFKRTNISRKSTYFPAKSQRNGNEEYKSFDLLIESLGGIDLQLLGLGLNGHIGFNEPNKSFVAETHCVTLEESTRAANSRFFESMDSVPKKAVTMGIKSIMSAKKIVLCVSGKEKSAILNQALFGAISPTVQGSILQLHSNLTIVADKEALSCSLDLL